MTVSKCNALVLSAFLGVFSTFPAIGFSQSWKPHTPTKIALPSNTNDPSKTIVIEAPELTASSTLTLPDGNSIGYLTNDGTGDLAWSALSSGTTSITNVNDSTTNSTSDTQLGLRDFDVVPGEGDYLILFNSYVENSGSNNRNEISIYQNGSQIQSTIRAVQPPSNKLYPVSTMAYVTNLQSGQHVDVRWHTSNGTMKMHHRSLIVMKLR